MNCLYIAGFSSGAQASRATGRLTDEGAQRSDLSLVLGALAEGSGYGLQGEGALAARLRLAGRDASLREGLHWIGLDQERIAVLEGLLEGGGGVLVLSAPSANLSASQGRASLLAEGPAAFSTVRILSSGTPEEPSLRVHTSVGEEPATQLLHTLRERIAVERRTVRRQADEKDLEYLREATYEFHETAEILEIRHVPYVVEEVVVRRDRYLEEQEVVETIRRLRAEVEEL